MAPARLLVAVEQRLVLGVEEQHAMTQAHPLQLVEHRRERVEILAAAHVADDRGALDLGAFVHEQLDQAADHARRQVVDAEVAGVLEHVHRGRLPGAREAGDDHQLLKRPEGIRHPDNRGAQPGRAASRP